MAVMAEQQYLALMPPLPNSPKEPKCYGSPAKCMTKRACFKVEKMPSIQRLIQAQALDLEAAAEDKKDGGEEDEEEEDAAGPIYTYKKSQYWSKEVDEKLGFAGADPYGLLELEERRWRASPDEIRKAYRKLVLTHHPDKKQSEEAVKAISKKESGNKENEKEGEEEEEGEEDDADAEFKLLGAAYELLGNVETRRQYDSIDNFNDYLPTVFHPKKSKSWFAVFGPPFARQAKFSSSTPVPQCGDEDTPYEQVSKFYKFWFAFSSWRDFGLLAEHDYKEAEDREERRWMQRQNKNFTDRIKKDERQRVQAFVQLAYDNDPRIIAYKEKAAAEKAAVKEAKEAARRAEKDAEEAAKAAKEAAEKEAQAAANAVKDAAKAVSADAKREKEKQRSALKKARKEIKALGEGAWAARASDIDVVAAVLEIDALLALTAALAAGVSDDATAKLNDAVALAMKQ